MCLDVFREIADGKQKFAFRLGVKRCGVHRVDHRRQRLKLGLGQGEGRHPARCAVSNDVVDFAGGAGSRRDENALASIGGSRFRVPAIATCARL
jgi:hypothetical protein